MTNTQGDIGSNDKYRGWYWE